MVQNLSVVSWGEPLQPPPRAIPSMSRQANGCARRLMQVNPMPDDPASRP
jgi:hypothetical protein